MDNYTVRNEIGEIDQKASLASYANALAKWCAENELPTETVQQAIDQVYDERDDAAKPGSMRLTLPILVGYVMAILRPEPKKFSIVEARIRAYVKGTARFDSSKGKGGGVARLAKMNETLPEKKTA